MFPFARNPCGLPVFDPHPTVAEAALPHGVFGKIGVRGSTHETASLEWPVPVLARRMLRRPGRHGWQQGRCVRKARSEHAA